MLPPEFRPTSKMPKLSIKDVMRMRERLKELAKDGKTFSVRDILTIRNEMMQKSETSQNVEKDLETPNGGMVDSRTVLMERMKAARAKTPFFGGSELLYKMWAPYL